MGEKQEAGVVAYTMAATAWLAQWRQLYQNWTGENSLF